MKTAKLITFIFLLNIIYFASSAQCYRIQVRPKRSNTWGYINLKGELVIPATYLATYSFSSDGYAFVETELEGLSLIDTTGKNFKCELKNFNIKSDYVGFGGYGAIKFCGFKNGLLPVRVKNKWGFVNTKGDIKITLRYSEVEGFNEGYSLCKRNGKHYVVNTAGVEIDSVDNKVVRADSFHEGLAIFVSTNKLYGFIDTTGEVAIPAKFLKVDNFSGSLAWARTTDNLVGFINHKGEWQIKPIYQAVYRFDPKSGIAMVKHQKNPFSTEWSYIDTKGQIIDIQNNRDSFCEFSEGLAKGKQNGLWGFYNKEGIWVIKPQFKNIRDFKNGYAAAESEGQWGIIDTQGNWVIQPQYLAIKDVEIINQ